MLLDKYLEQESLTFESYEDAAAVQKILIENGYCTMMSREEHVIFVNRAEYEYKEYEWLKKHPEYMEEDE